MEERQIIKEAIANNAITKDSGNGSIVCGDDYVSWAMNDGSKYFSVNNSLFPYRYAPKSGRLFEVDPKNGELRMYIADVIAKANKTPMEEKAPAKVDETPMEEKTPGPVVVQFDYNGVEEQLPADQYTVEFKCPLCLGVRYIKPQDVFQVKLSKPCMKKVKRSKINAWAKARRAAKKAGAS